MKRIELGTQIRKKVQNHFKSILKKMFTIQWLGHVKRMALENLPRRILKMKMENKKRTLGRPRIR